MKAVAAKAGVSVSTVCRALGHDQQIPAETRERIQKIATALGYRPDPLLSAFAKRRRGHTEGSEITTIAYVTNFPAADEWMQNPFYRQLFEGASARAASNGYRVEHFWMREPGMTGERFSRILQNRGIGALCIAPTPAVRSRLSLEWDRFSCVAIGYSLLRPDLNRTTPHHFHAILVAVRRLARLGYRRIGLCLFSVTSRRVDDLWLAGALLTEQYHPEVSLSAFIFDDETLGNLCTWTATKRVEVILSDNQIVARELRRHGLRIPGDIDYATLNWTKSEPEIAGINQRPDQIGASAIDLVIAQLRRGERGVPASPTTTMVEGEWVNGPSLLKKPVTLRHASAVDQTE